MKIEIQKIKKSLGPLAKIPTTLAQHVFLTCLFLFLLSLILGGFLFYKYSILVKRKEPEFPSETLLLKEETHQEVLKIWQEHENKFQEADFKEYPDLFRETVLAPEEGEEGEELTE